MLNKDRWPEGQLSGKTGVEEALNRLNAKMVYAEVEPVELVSCGGAALNLLSLVTRTTSDVNIICAVQVTKGKVRLLTETKLPHHFEKFVKEVGQELGIKDEWLNFGPAPLLKFGLPEGLEKRLIRKSYGRCLALHIISRLDQIHLKLYAAMDPKTRIEIHLGDLMELEPTEEEVKTAMKWLLNRKTSTDFRNKLKMVLDRIGHEQIAQTI